MSSGQETQLAFMTAPSQEVAAAIVHTLVEERLVACGNILPGLTSVYRWQGTIEHEAEVLVLLKTTAERVPQLLERVPALHPYEVPELLIVPIAAGHAPYLKWVADSVANATVES